MGFKKNIHFRTIFKGFIGFWVNIRISIVIIFFGSQIFDGKSRCRFEKWGDGTVPNEILSRKSDWIGNILEPEWFL